MLYYVRHYVQTTSPNSEPDNLMTSHTVYLRKIKTKEEEGHPYIRLACWRWAFVLPMECRRTDRFLSDYDQRWRRRKHPVGPNMQPEYMVRVKFKPQTK